MEETGTKFIDEHTNWKYEYDQLKSVCDNLRNQNHRLTMKVNAVEQSIREIHNIAQKEIY